MTLNKNLIHLESVGLVRIAATVPELEFMFRHALMQDAAYQSLLKADRRVLHQVVGETIEMVYATGLDTRAETLALHFQASGDLVRCLTYSVRAAEQAERVFAHDEASRHYERARECAVALNQTEQLVAIDEAMGDVYAIRGSHPLVVEAYERALVLALSPTMRAALKAKIGETYAWNNDERGLPFLQAARRV